MQLIIHRGTQEIGGSCVEVRSNSNRILIDFGIPLVFNRQQFDINLLKAKSVDELKAQRILPDIRGLYKNESKGIDAILISHSHLDHYGLLQYVDQKIPVYLSEGANILIEVSNVFIPIKVGRLNTRIIKHGKQFAIGEFVVTPFLVDHSAFDALAFLIEADGKRLFYSGDFRGHGRKSALFKQILKNPPKEIDCLLMEGTMLGRKDVVCKDEEAVQQKIEDILKTNDRYTFLFTSSQNIDRIVSAYKACLKTDSLFVIDIYTAFVLERLSLISEHIPQYSWRNVRVMLARFYAEKLKEASFDDLLSRYKKKAIYMYEIRLRRNKTLILSRDNSIFRNMANNFDCIPGSTIIYSQWEGYLTDEFLDFCRGRNLKIEKVHASGHARLEDLKEFACALKPRKLIPIHTFESGRYPSTFENVKILKDKEVLDLDIE